MWCPVRDRRQEANKYCTPINADGRGFSFTYGRPLAKNFLPSVALVFQAGVVNGLPFSASRMARSRAGLVELALRDTAWSWPGVSIHISPAA